MKDRQFLMPQDYIMCTIFNALSFLPPLFAFPLHVPLYHSSPSPAPPPSPWPYLSLGLSCCIYENKTLDYVHLLVVWAPSETSYIPHGPHRPNNFWYEVWGLIDDCTLKVCALWWQQRWWCWGLVADWSQRLACKQHAVVLDTRVINLSVGSRLIGLYKAPVLFWLSLKWERSGCWGWLCLGLAIGHYR